MAPGIRVKPNVVRRKFPGAGRLNCRPPETLFRKIRRCKTLVLLGTAGAVRKPENIAPEVAEFATANGTSRIISISFDAGAEFADWSKTPWYPLVQGKSRERESPAALLTGEPSPTIVSTIATASNYMKSKDRLLKYRNRALGGFLVLVLAALLAGGLAMYGSLQARKWRNEAQTAQLKAKDTIDKAHDETRKAVEQSQRDIQKAQDDAKAKIAESVALVKAADDKRAAADLLRRAALAQSKKQQTIANARSLANQSQIVLRQRPAEVPRSTSLAVTQPSGTAP